MACSFLRHWMTHLMSYCSQVAIKAFFCGVYLRQPPVYGSTGYFPILKFLEKRPETDREGHWCVWLEQWFLVRYCDTTYDSNGEINISFLCDYRTTIDSAYSQHPPKQLVECIVDTFVLLSVNWTRFPGTVHKHNIVNFQWYYEWLKLSRTPLSWILGK